MSQPHDERVESMDAEQWREILGQDNNNNGAAGPVEKSGDESKREPSNEEG
jgi:hypothetical protein